MPLTHFDEQGASRMVDTSAKSETVRTARASGLVQMLEATWKLIQNSPLSRYSGREVGGEGGAGGLGDPTPTTTKGNVLEVARLAGIMAAKQTGTLIPLCHPLPLTGVTIDFTFPTVGQIRIEAEAKVVGRTGVEMEALTAVSVAALTVYDMCKSADKGIVISQIQLESKTGGKSGDWRRA